MSPYDYNTYNTEIPAGAGAIVAVTYLVTFALVILCLVAQWHLFKKAGYNGWEAIVPFYNSYCLCDIVLGNGLLFLIMFVPFVNGLFSLFLMFKMAEVYNKSSAFGLGLVFLSPIFLCLMAFDKSTYYSGPSVRARASSGYGSYGSYGSYGAGGYGAGSYGAGSYGSGSYGSVPNMTNDYQTYNSSSSGYQNNGFQAQGQPMQQNNGFQAQGQPMQQNNGFQAQGQPMQQNNGFQAQGQPMQQNGGFQAQGQRVNPFEKPGENNYYGSYNSYSGYNNQNGNF